MEVSTMARVKENLQRVHWRKIITSTSLALFAFWSLGFLGVVSAQSPAQKMFSSPGQASRALFLAVQSRDEKALLEIFGPDGKEIIFSGDAAEDKNSRDQFVRKYQEMNRLVEEPDGTIRIYVGAENWPMPVPLMNKGDAWFFDSGVGKEEIWVRQIGRNEIAAIRVLQELIDAQKEYYAESPAGEAKQYAQKFVSDEGKHNGLYWKIGRGESESPIGPHLAYAGGDTQPADSNSEAKPFYGYYFQILTKQGEHGGEAKNYVANGKMTEGFAFLAYPAQYAMSGVMTFMVSQDGVIYQKDLGPNTADLAKALSVYDPDKTWEKVE
jgi:Protein of unknown function (DUF2950)